MAKTNVSGNRENAGSVSCPKRTWKVPFLGIAMVPLLILPGCIRLAVYSAAGVGIGASIPIRSAGRAIRTSFLGDYDKGSAYEGEGNFEKAIEYYTTSLKQDPEPVFDELARLRIACCYIELGRKHEERKEKYYSQAKIILHRLSDEASSKAIRDTALFKLECDFDFERLQWTSGRWSERPNREAMLRSCVEARERFAKEHPDNLYSGKALYEASSICLSRHNEQRKVADLLIRLIRDHPAARERLAGRYPGWENEGRAILHDAFSRLRTATRVTIPDDRQWWLRWWGKNKDKVPKTAGPPFQDLTGEYLTTYEDVTVRLLAAVLRNENAIAGLTRVASIRAAQQSSRHVPSIRHLPRDQRVREERESKNREEKIKKLWKEEIVSAIVKESKRTDVDIQIVQNYFWCLDHRKVDRPFNLGEKVYVKLSPTEKEGIDKSSLMESVRYVRQFLVREGL